MKGATHFVSAQFAGDQLLPRVTAMTLQGEILTLHQANQYVDTLDVDSGHSAFIERRHGKHWYKHLFTHACGTNE